MSLYTVQATLILDNEGRRLLAKYYVPPAGPQRASPLAKAPLAEQKAFEKRLTAKSVGLNNDILLLDGHLILYKQCSDLLIYLICPQEENEMVAYNALIALRDSISAMLVHQVDRATALTHYDRLALVVDEIIDNGVVMATDRFAVVERTTTSANEEPSLQNIDLSEKSFKKAFNFAAGRLAQAVRQQLG